MRLRNGQSLLATVMEPRPSNSVTLGVRLLFPQHHRQWVWQHHCEQFADGGCKCQWVALREGFCITTCLLLAVADCRARFAYSFAIALRICDQHVILHGFGIAFGYRLFFFLRYTHRHVHHVWGICERARQQKWVLQSVLIWRRLDIALRLRLPESVAVRYALCNAAKVRPRYCQCVRLWSEQSLSVGILNAPHLGLVHALANDVALRLGYPHPG